jgi:hypothetical protein
MYYFLFDYIWYRIARVYYKWDSDGVTASAFVGLSQGIFLGNTVYAIALKAGSVDSIYRGDYADFVKYLGVGIILWFVVLNYFLYRKRYWVCRDRWLKEPKGLVYYLKGSAVLFFLLLPWVWFFNLLPYVG